MIRQRLAADPKVVIFTRYVDTMNYLAQQIQRDKRYAHATVLTIHGGLDVSHVLPRATEEELVATIRRYMEALKPGGGFIFNTEHFVPATATLARLELAYETALRHAWY